MLCMVTNSLEPTPSAVLPPPLACQCAAARPSSAPTPVLHPSLARSAPVLCRPRRSVPVPLSAAVYARCRKHNGGVTSPPTTAGAVIGDSQPVPVKLPVSANGSIVSVSELPGFVSGFFQLRVSAGSTISISPTQTLKYWVQ